MFFSLFYLILIVVQSMNFTHSYHADAATSAKSECKISDFQQTDKRKKQKSLTFFVIFMFFWVL